MEGLGMICRSCGAELQESFADLGVQPLANAYLTAEDLGKMEPFYPLKVLVCGRCFLVQVGEFESPQNIFGDYAYFSSYSDSWLAHAKAYAEAAILRFGLHEQSSVVEIASNDGYLLRNFRDRNIPVLGVEPARNVAEVAVEAGIPTTVDFFSAATARRLVSEGHGADLLVGNNVLAHVPALNDFVEGLRILLKPEGVLTMEFPHLLCLVAENQLDTIYHEHFSYFSLLAVDAVFARHGLTIFDVDELPTHGGSLRIYARHADQDSTRLPSVEEIRERERAAGYEDLAVYRSFGDRVMAVKRALLRFLIDAREQGKSVAAYGAPAKGNTLLNYCGAGPDLVEYTVDRSPHKQGRFLPGTRIAIRQPDHIRETRPDYLLILPWNLRYEICEQMAYIREWGGRFVVAVPRLEIFE